MVEDMTARTMALTPPLIPNGSHWRLPTADWVQQQQAAQEHSQAPSWWQGLFRGPARFLGLVEDSLQGVEASNAGQTSLECMAFHCGFIMVCLVLLWRRWVHAWQASTKMLCMPHAATNGTQHKFARG